MSSEKEILALEDKRFAAMIGGDWKTVQGLAHDQLLYTHSSAITDTKARWLESMTSGKTKYKSASFTDRKVRMIGDAALVTGGAAIEAEINGQPRSLRLKFLNVWTKTPEGWKFVAWQSTTHPQCTDDGPFETPILRALGARRSCAARGELHHRNVLVNGGTFLN